jgi:hypothetical protein
MADRQSEVVFTLDWRSSEHLSIAFLAPGDVPQQPSPSAADLYEESELVDISYAAAGENFFLRIGRNGSGETLFDTRLGSLSSEGGALSFTTILPTPYFTGLKGKSPTNNDSEIVLKAWEWEETLLYDLTEYLAQCS